MSTCLHVTSEIGPLRKVCLHRPGDELAHLLPSRLPDMLFDDIPYLPEAQREHDAFADLLRAEGVEVVYLEDLVAEVFDQVPGTREEFLDQYLAEAGLRGRIVPEAVRSYLSSITDNRRFVRTTMAGVTKSELDLPHDVSLPLDALVSVESETGIVVEPMPNLYFTRDPFTVVGSCVSLNRMFSPVRNREAIYGKYLFKYHPAYRDTTLLYRRDASFHIEGGDIHVLNERTLAIGISQRTQAAAIDVLAQNVFWYSDSKVERILAFAIPPSRAFMHLDTVFSQIDRDAFTVYREVMGSLEVFELTPGRTPGTVDVREIDDTLEHILADAVGLDAVRLIPCGGGDVLAAAREQWNDGSNTLALAPGRICVYQRNVRTNEALARAGMELVVLPSAELSRGRGGPRCMSMPFVRDDVSW